MLMAIRHVIARAARGLAPIAAAVIPVRLRIDSENAVDAADDATRRAANDPTNKATDRSEHAVTGISTAVNPVVHPSRHALRLCGDRRGEKEADSNHTEYSHWSAFPSVSRPIALHDGDKGGQAPRGSQGG